jgi:hypothetical protein
VKAASAYRIITSLPQSQALRKAGKMATRYLSVKEAAEELGWKPKTLRNKMSAGIFRQGIHYFKRKGIRPRFIRGSLEAWLEGNDNDLSHPDVPQAKRGRSAKGTKEAI